MRRILLMLLLVPCIVIAIHAAESGMIPTITPEPEPEPVVVAEPSARENPFVDMKDRVCGPIVWVRDNLVTFNGWRLAGWNKGWVKLDEDFRVERTTHLQVGLCPQNPPTEPHMMDFEPDPQRRQENNRMRGYVGFRVSISF